MRVLSNDDLNFTSGAIIDFDRICGESCARDDDCGGYAFSFSNVIQGMVQGPYNYKPPPPPTTKTTTATTNIDLTGDSDNTSIHRNDDRKRKYTKPIAMQPEHLVSSQNVCLLLHKDITYDFKHIRTYELSQPEYFYKDGDDVLYQVRRKADPLPTCSKSDHWFGYVFCFLFFVLSYFIFT